MHAKILQYGTDFSFLVAAVRLMHSNNSFASNNEIEEEDEKNQMEKSGRDVAKLRFPSGSFTPQQMDWFHINALVYGALQVCILHSGFQQSRVCFEHGTCYAM